MRSIPRLLLALLTALFVLSACGGDDAETTATSETTEETVEEAADETTETEESTAAEATEEATDDTTEAETTDAAAAGDENVEINLIDELDGIINGYCLDIAGCNESVDPANGLQVHTCYSYQGDLGTDQVFATAEFANDALYMPIYEVCAEVASVSAGSTVGLNTCDGGELQTVSFEDDGTLRPTADTSLCFTAGSESRTGRSGDHQIRDLSLEACSDDLASLQQWSFRTGL